MSDIQLTNHPQLPRPRRRRIVPIVDARFQWKYTLIIVALGVGLSTIMGGLLFNAHLDNTRLLDLSDQLQKEVMHGDQMFLLYLIVFVVVMGVCLGFWGLIVTHRISGPLYIVARYLGTLASGNYPDVRPLRKRDELHDFFAAFEDAMNAMRNRDIMTVRDIESTLSEVKKGLEGDTKASLQSAIRTLQRHRDSLMDTIGTEHGVPVETD